MNEIKDGGPAFPVPNDANVNGQEGMTLRDYFAAKAMQGFCVNHDPGCEATLAEIENGARVAYQMADAMLKAREVKP